jgi:hypothetical protein
VIAEDIAFKMKNGLAVSGLERAGGRLLGGAAAGLAIGNASGSPVLGGLGGAAAGFAVGGPLGAVAGGVSGFVSGLLSSAAKAREAALKMAEARKAFETNLADFVAIAHPRGSLGDALANLTRQAQELQKAASAAVGGDEKSRQQALGAGDVSKLSQAQIQAALDAKNLAIAHGASGRAARDYLAELLRVRKAYDDNVAAAKEQRALEEKRFGEDLAVRQLRAQGRDAEAEAAAFANAQAREFADVQKGMGDAINQTILDSLTLTQAMEAQAFAARQAAVEAQKAAEAERRRREEIRASQDLDVEFLNALGQKGAAEDLQFTLDQQRRREQEVAAGRSQDFLDKLDALQQLQREQRVKEQAAPAGGEFDAGGIGASKGGTLVSAVVTERTALMLFDLQRQGVGLLTFLPKIEANTRGGTTGGGGGGARTVTVNIRLTRDFTDADVRELIRKINEGMGREWEGEKAFSWTGGT